MGNKEYLIRILMQLSAIRPSAKGLIIMLKKNKLSVKIIDEITKKLDIHIKSIKTQEEQAKLKLGISTIQRIKLKEEENKKLDNDDLKSIEALLGL